jgi:hypothetical protein
MVPPISQNAAFDRQFTVSDGFFYFGQPAKTAAYNLGGIALPFLLGLGYWCGHVAAARLPNRMLDRLTWLGAVLYLALIMACAWPMVYCPHPPLPIVPPSWLLLPVNFSSPFLSPERFFFLFSAAGILLFFVASPDCRRHARWAALLLGALWLVSIPSRFYLPSEIDDGTRFTYHLNSVLDALSQSINGHHWLVDFPHIYGGYSEMLAPLIRLFPRGVGVLITSLALPNVMGMLGLLLMARLVIRHPAHLFICGLALLGVCYLSTSRDLTYGYSTARTFFPPVVLLVATLHFRQPGGARYAMTTALAVLASIWNLDTGLVVWASWLATLVALEWKARNFMGVLRNVFVQTLSLAAAWTSFFLYLRLVSGQWPDGGMLFYFQKIVLGSGYFCVPVIFPDMWMFVLSIYLIALAVALALFFRTTPNWLTSTTLMIALLGVGIFSYFMGRSAESNLVGVAYPAVLLAGIFCDRVDAFSRRPGRLPGSAKFFLLPCRLALLWWAFLFVAALPETLATSGRVARNWNNTDETSLRANAAFVVHTVDPHEDGVFFLSNHSGIYYYLSDTVRSLKMPGMIELMRTSDMEILVDAIRNRQINKLFVEQNFYSIEMYRPDVYQEVRTAVRENYRVHEVGPTGNLVLYLPR